MLGANWASTRTIAIRLFRMNAPIMDRNLLARLKSEVYPFWIDRDDFQLGLKRSFDTSRVILKPFCLSWHFLSARSVRRFLGFVFFFPCFSVFFFIIFQIFGTHRGYPKDASGMLWGLIGDALGTDWGYPGNGLGIP